MFGPLSRYLYLNVLRRTVVRETMELSDDIGDSATELEVLFGMFHDKVLSFVKENGHREPRTALEYWKHMN